MTDHFFLALAAAAAAAVAAAVALAPPRLTRPPTGLAEAEPEEGSAWAAPEEAPEAEEGAVCMGVCGCGCVCGCGTAAEEADEAAAASAASFHDDDDSLRPLVLVDLIEDSRSSELVVPVDVSMSGSTNSPSSFGNGSDSFSSCAHGYG